MPEPADTLAQKAVDLINRFGSTVTFTVTSGGTIDAGAGSVSGATETTHEVKAVASSYSARETDGVNVLKQDVKLLLAALGLPFVPDTTVYAELAGQSYRVQHLKREIAQDVVITYELQARAL